MSQAADPQVLSAFVEATRRSLPRLLETSNVYRRHPSQREALAEALAILSVMQGSAEAVGCAEFRHLASMASELLSQVERGHLELSGSCASAFEQATMTLDFYLQALQNENLDEGRLAGETERVLEPFLGRSPQEARPASLLSAPSKTDESPLSEPLASGPLMEEGIPADLAKGFREEAADLLGAMEIPLQELRSSPEELSPLEEIRRHVHTLKGAAGMVGFSAIASVAHWLEDLLEALHEGHLPLVSKSTDALRVAVDLLADLGEPVLDEPRLRGEVATLHRRFEALLASSSKAAASVAAPVDVASEISAGVQASISTPESLSLSGRRLESHLASACEVAATLLAQQGSMRSRAETLRGATKLLHGGLERLRRLAARLEVEGRLRKRDPSMRGAEHSAEQLFQRELEEGTREVASAAGTLESASTSLEAGLEWQLQTSQELQAKLAELQVEPFESLVPALRRTAGNAASERGVEVDFEVEGEELVFDAWALELLAEPLERLVRERVEHGLESPEQRRVLGKHQRGALRVRVAREGASVVLEVSDDGAGSDLASPSASGVPDAGLELASRAAESLGGTVVVSSESGRGTTVTFFLPPAPRVERLLFFEAGGEIFAISMDAVRQVTSLGRVGASRDESVRSTLDLAACLGLRPSEKDHGESDLVVLVAGGAQLAIRVERLMGTREAVVTDLGRLVRRARGFLGATWGEDGQVVLVLDPEDVVQRAREQVVEGGLSAVASERQRPRELEVFIVDDSASVRRVLSHMVEAAGWKAIVAKDGRDASELVECLSAPPDIVLVDVEMPRMDGYELTSHLRALEPFRHLPIVVITSRVGEKHRRRAFEVGATEYLVKPYQEETLLRLIRELAVPVS